ncbi:cytochrome P450 [Wilcoxina mikolae CBS 423.85]|nr:cytochrome P450 [Wilcoxina mikolae CBS 423.85]
MSLYSRQTFNNRGPFYESGYAASRSYNVLNVRDNEQHRLWRRIWDQAFKASALSEYAPRVELHVEKFISVLEKINGEEVNCLKPIQNLAYDIMADLGFGRDIGTQDGEDGSLMEFLRSYLRAVTTIGSLRNLCDMMSILPSGLKSAKSIHFQKKSIEMLEHRKRMGKSRADVFTHLLAEDTETGTTFSDAELASNSRLLIVAGSDTTSTTIACIFRELALNPSIQQKLYEEVHTAAQGFPVLDSKNTKDLPYLNGVVKETLRLWNPVPSGAETLTGPEGATVVGRYIPPNTTIRVHHYALMTDDRYFPQGDKFIPERWTDQKMEGVKDIRAWVPFSYGPHACVGKHLALTEIRLTVARTVERFSIELGETYDDELFRKEWKSYVTVVLGDVPVRFKPR